MLTKFENHWFRKFGKNVKFNFVSSPPKENKIGKKTKPTEINYVWPESPKQIYRRVSVHFLIFRIDELLFAAIAAKVDNLAARKESTSCSLPEASWLHPPLSAQLSKYQNTSPCSHVSSDIQLVSFNFSLLIEISRLM